MDLFQALALFAAGMVAGGINVVVGSGTLVTFPTLLAFGYPSVLANVTNTVGLVPGSAAGAVAYRRELREQRDRVLRLAVASTVGGITGALLLLELPSAAFDAIVPVLILLGCSLVIVQPWLSGWVARHRERSGTSTAAHGGALTFVLVLLTGVYGGYFGAAQGVLLMAIMGILINDDLQRLNGVKNVLAGLVNLVAALVFIVASHVAWDAAALIAAGSTLGGTLGGRYGRRLPPQALRAFIVVVGVVAAVKLLAT
jgi:uncharacterized membrane protein YfcA